MIPLCAEAATIPINEIEICRTGSVIPKEMNGQMLTRDLVKEEN
jgi:hypothetical protein